MTTWYKRGEPFPVNDMVSISAVKNSLLILLNSIKEFTPCNHGNGWKLQKFHETMHLPVDIFMFGSPQNYDNSPTEHGLIETVKHPADHAQKSWLLFVSQVTKRLMETVLIKKAKQSLQHSCEIDMVEKSDNDFLNLPNSASFHITVEDNSACVPRWLGKKHLQESITLNSDLLTWIQSSNRNKKSFFMIWKNFMCTCSTCKMELFFVVIQIINQMVNDMIR